MKYNKTKKIETLFLYFLVIILLLEVPLQVSAEQGEREFFSEVTEDSMEENMGDIAEETVNVKGSSESNVENIEEIPEMSTKEEEEMLQSENSEINSEEETEDVLEETKESVWYFAGFFDDMEDSYTVDMETAIIEYTALLDNLKNAIGLGQTEYDFQDTSLSVEEARNVVLYIMKQIDIQSSSLLPAVAYTYVEKENELGEVQQFIQSIEFSYLEEADKLVGFLIGVLLMFGVFYLILLGVLINTTGALH